VLTASHRLRVFRPHDFISDIVWTSGPTSFAPGPLVAGRDRECEAEWLLLGYITRDREVTATTLSSGALRP